MFSECRETIKLVYAFFMFCCFMSYIDKVIEPSHENTCLWDFRPGRLKPVCTATEARSSRETLDVVSIGIVLSR